MGIDPPFLVPARVLLWWKYGSRAATASRLMATSSTVVDRGTVSSASKLMRCTQALWDGTISPPEVSTSLGILTVK